MNTTLAATPAHPFIADQLLGAVLFDLDGTLLDTAPDFAFVLNLQREQHGLPALDPELVRTRVSEGARAVVALGFADQHAPGSEGFESLRQEFLTLYRRHLSRATEPFPGMNALLLDLERHNVHWGIVTNKPSLYAEPLLQDMGLAQRCSVLVCPDHVSQTKPHAEPLQKAASLLSLTTRECLYVGDHARDIECARNAGMHSIAASWGYLAEGEDPASWQADATVASVADLHQLIFPR